MGQGHCRSLQDLRFDQRQAVRRPPMPVLNRIAAYAEEMKTWRQPSARSTPSFPSIVTQTAAFIAAIGCARSGWTRSTTGIARTGIVADDQWPGGPGRPSACAPIWTRCRSLRSTGARTMPRACRARCMPAAMTAMSPCFWARPNTWPRRGAFAGRVALIFQPAEEDGAGGAGHGARGHHGPV